MKERIQGERIKPWSRKGVVPGRFILYWMQTAQRAEYNQALEYAVERANEMNLPLLVYFGLCERYPEANERHFAFMLQGLAEVGESLHARGIRFVMQLADPAAGAVALARDASLAVVDGGYLKREKQWRRSAALKMRCPLIEVDANLIVPVREASDREEYMAATLRPKIKAKLERFLLPLNEGAVRRDSLSVVRDSLDWRRPERILASLDIDRQVKRVHHFRGGLTEARRQLACFIANELDDYAETKNDPGRDTLSQLSPYLHFGQISPLEVALSVRASGKKGRASFLDELIIRRELSFNFVFYNRRYDSFSALPDWARSTLARHGKDRRPVRYSRRELEWGKTHDPFWNAAQMEMVVGGKMHGYMRMYWGKKILEWSANPEEAFRTALTLNNRYELDGRDANGFAGIAWCFGKHDRPWPGRPVFGNVRSMTASGLERKTDIAAYVRRVKELLAAAEFPASKE